MLDALAKELEGDNAGPGREKNVKADEVQLKEREEKAQAKAQTMSAEERKKLEKEAMEVLQEKPPACEKGLKRKGREAQLPDEPARSSSSSKGDAPGLQGGESMSGKGLAARLARPGEQTSLMHLLGSSEPSEGKAAKGTAKAKAKAEGKTQAKKKTKK